MSGGRADDARFMAQALALAARALGETNPNPLVGCVVVRNGRVVGEGFHRRAGTPHAEVHALAAAGRRARGATVYVTLEPCAHHGRTPPCAPLVAASGAARVVVAQRDPNRLVNGRGLRLLRLSGLSVDVGVGRAEAEALNRRFTVAQRARRPYVLLKAALTLDGRIATASGDSRWITSASQRSEGRRLRRLHDGVAVGIGTVLADDPLLLPAPRLRRSFHRLVFDNRLRLPPSCQLVRSITARTPVWVVYRQAERARLLALQAAGVRTLRLPRGSTLETALFLLRVHGLTSLMVEGGGELLGSFLRERLFDDVVLFRAPILLGGRGSRSAFGGPNPASLREAVALRAAPARLTESLGTAPGPPLFEHWIAPPARSRR